MADPRSKAGEQLVCVSRRSAINNIALFRDRERVASKEYHGDSITPTDIQTAAKPLPTPYQHPLHHQEAKQCCCPPRSSHDVLDRGSMERTVRSLPMRRSTLQSDEPNFACSVFRAPTRNRGQIRARVRIRSARPLTVLDPARPARPRALAGSGFSWASG